MTKRIANDIRKFWKLMTSLWMVRTQRKKKSAVVICLRKWSASLTDEFSSETLILRKRLSSLYTKCVQFLSWPSLLFCTCYAGEMMIPCQVSTFSEFILSWFSVSRSFSSLNKSVNDWKIANDVRMFWKLMTSLWMVRTERKESLEL